MYKMTRYVDTVASLLIGVALCSTAAVYTEAAFSIEDQIASIIAVCLSLILTAIFRSSQNSTITPLPSRPVAVQGIYLVLLVAVFSCIPVARTSNFTGETDQYTTAAYTMAVIATPGVFIFHVRLCGLRLLFGCSSYCRDIIPWSACYHGGLDSWPSRVGQIATRGVADQRLSKQYLGDKFGVTNWSQPTQRDGHVVSNSYCSRFAQFFTPCEPAWSHWNQSFDDYLRTANGALYIIESMCAIRTTSK